MRWFQPHPILQGGLVALVAIRDPDRSDGLPVGPALDHCEPRPRREVNALQSPPAPQVRQPHALDLAAGLQPAKAAGAVE